MGLGKVLDAGRAGPCRAVPGRAQAQSEQGYKRDIRLGYIPTGGVEVEAEPSTLDRLKRVGGFLVTTYHNIALDL